MRQHTPPAGCSWLRPCFLPDDLLQLLAECRALLLHRSLTSLSVRNIGIYYGCCKSSAGAAIIISLATHACSDELSWNFVRDVVHGIYIYVHAVGFFH
jgi:hypothetical protein